jgi:hypothetical protein
VEVFEPASTRAAPTTDWIDSLLNKLSNSCSLYSLRADPRESTISNSLLLWRHVFLVTNVFMGRSLAMAVSFDSTVRVFQLPCHYIKFKLNCSNCDILGFSSAKTKVTVL